MAEKTNKDNPPSPRREVRGEAVGVSTSTRYQWASPDRYKLLKAYAKENRQHATEAESILWEAIRNKKLGFEFRRQHIISDYIADFVCLDKMLIIEVDGGYHSEIQQQEDDAIRTERLEGFGFRVIRFTNEAIINTLPMVIDEIKTASSTASPPTPLRGEGGRNKNGEIEK